MKQFVYFLCWILFEGSFAHYDNGNSGDEIMATRGRTKREAHTLDSMSLFWIAAAAIVATISLIIALSVVVYSPPATHMLLWWKRRKSVGLRRKPSVDEEFPLGEIFHRDGFGGIVLERDYNAKLAQKAFIVQQCAAKNNGALIIEHPNGTLNPAFISDDNHKGMRSSNASLHSMGNNGKGSSLKSLSANESNNTTYVANTEGNLQSKMSNTGSNLNNENENNKNYEVEKGKYILTNFNLSPTFDTGEKENEIILKTKAVRLSRSMGFGMSMRDIVLLAKSADNLSGAESKIEKSTNKENDITIPLKSALSSIELRSTSEQRHEYDIQKDRKVERVNLASPNVIDPEVMYWYDKKVILGSHGCKCGLCFKVVD